MARSPSFFKSPLHKLFGAYPDLRNVETIDSTPRATSWTPTFTKRVAASRGEAMALVAELEATGALCIFSDGSGEDGLVGSAAVATDPLSGELRVQRAHLGPLAEHTVFESELLGMLLALRILDELRTVRDEAFFLLDNQASLSRTHNPRPKSGQLITNAIIEAAEQIRARRPDLRLTLVWVPGHEGVEGNELADLHAKMASSGEDTEGAELDEDVLPASAAALRATFKQQTLAQWQQRWATSERGQRYARFDSTPPSAHVALHVPRPEARRRRCPHATPDWPCRAQRLPAPHHRHGLPTVCPLQ